MNFVIDTKTIQKLVRKNRSTIQLIYDSIVVWHRYMAPFSSKRRKQNPLRIAIEREQECFRQSRLDTLKYKQLFWDYQNAVLLPCHTQKKRLGKLRIFFALGTFVSFVFNLFFCLNLDANCKPSCFSNLLVLVLTSS